MADKKEDQASRAARRSADQTTRFARQRLEDVAEAGAAEGEQLAQVVAATASTYRELTDSSRRDIERLASSNARIFNALQEMGWESFRFAQDGMRSSMDVLQQAYHCRSAEEMAALQRDLVRENVERTFEGSARILRIGCDAALEVVETLQDRSEAGGA